jgi:hypothetical protein
LQCQAIWRQFLAIGRGRSVGRPDDQKVGPVPSYPKTEDASVGPVLATFFRFRPDAGPTMRPEDLVGLDRRPTEPARANPELKGLRDLSTTALQANTVFSCFIATTPCHRTQWPSALQSTMKYLPRRSHPWTMSTSISFAVNITF